MTLSHTLPRVLVPLTIAAGFATLVWAAVIQPGNTWSDARVQTRAKLVGQIEKLRHSLAELQAERAQISSGETEGIFWTAERAGEATALVQSEISSIARARGLALRSIAPTEPRKLHSVTGVGFRLEAEAHLDDLMAFLRDIEFHSPTLMVERATLRRLNRVGQNDAQPVIFVQLDLLAPLRLKDSQTEAMQ